MEYTCEYLNVTECLKNSIETLITCLNGGVKRNRVKRGRLN